MRGFRIFFQGGGVWWIIVFAKGVRGLFSVKLLREFYIFAFSGGGGRTLPLQTCFLCIIFSSTETHCNISICHYNRKIKLYSYNSYNMNFLMSFLEQRFIFQNMIRIKNFTVNFNGGMYYEMYLNNILYLSLHIWVMMEHSKLCWQCVGINGTSYKKYVGTADKGNL